MHSFLRRPRRALGRHLRTRTRGQSLVELALILPIFMLFFAAILDLGRVAAAQIAVTNAAREGVFQAAKTPADHDSTKSCPADGASNVIYCRVKLESSGGVAIAPTDVSVSCNPIDCAAGIGNTVSVRVDGHFRLLTPLMAVFFGGNQNVTFESTATANRETLPVDGLNTPAPTATATPTPTPTATPTSTATATATATATPTATPCTLPSAGFTYTVSGSPSQRAPQTVTVVDTSTSTSCGLASWFWTWGDGSTSNLRNPGSHTYYASNPAKSYAITLTVWNNAGGFNTSGIVLIPVK